MYFTPYLSKHATVDELPLAKCIRQRVKCYVLQKENNKSHNQFESRTSPTLHGKQGEEITADGHQYIIIMIRGVNIGYFGLA